MSIDSATSSYWLCPLYSFDCYTEIVDLAEGIQIKRAPTELKEYIHDKTYYLYGLWEDPSEFIWAVFLPYRSTNVDGLSIEERMSVGFREQDRDRDSLIDLLTALRLHHGGRIVAGPMISASIDDSEWHIGGTTIWTRVSEKNFILEDQKYCLSREDVAEVNNLLQDIRKWCNDGTLNKIDIALRRFHSSYHGRFEDRVIDQMIAFESLYLGYDPELKYRLALRVAFLLGKDNEEREYIFSNMRKAYDLRSDIVHGNRQVEISELSSTVPKTEDYLRQSIRRFLLLLSPGNSLKEIREKLLDENILKNGKLLAFRE